MIVVATTLHQRTQVNVGRNKIKVSTLPSLLSSQPPAALLIIRYYPKRPRLQAKVSNQLRYGGQRSVAQAPRTADWFHKL